MNATDSQFKHIIKQILDGIEHMHSRGVIHRDIKVFLVGKLTFQVENILCTYSDYPKIKIADFGLSEIAEKDALLDRYCGSIHYISPEVLTRTPYSFEIDIWGIGVVGYVLRSGYFPIYIDSVIDEAFVEKFLELIDEEEHFKEEYFKMLSPSVQDFLRGFLKLKPRDRFSIAEAKRFLKKIKAGSA